MRFRGAHQPDDSPRRTAVLIGGNGKVEIDAYHVIDRFIPSRNRERFT